MRKLLLLSVVLATLAIPVLAARHRNASRGLWITLVLFLLFNALYVAAIARFVRSPF